MPRLARVETAAARDRPRFRALVEDLRRSLADHGRGPPRLQADDDLALLEAVDSHLAEDLYGVDRYEVPPRVQVAGKAYDVHRRPRGWTARFTGQSGHLQRWMAHHWVVPSSYRGLRVRVTGLDLLTSDAILARLRSDRIKPRAASFRDGVRPEIRKVGDAAFICPDLDDAETRWSELEAALDEAEENGVDILVFPELTVTPDLRQRVVQRLAASRSPTLRLVLPGSFHEDLEREEGVRNRALLLNGGGETVLEHLKIRTFDLDSSEGTRREHLQSGTEIRLLETPLGLLGMPICLDFCDEGEPILGLWHALGVEWVLVPSMGTDSTLKAHERRAAQLQRAHGTTTVVAHQDMTPDRGEEERKGGFVLPA